MQTVDVRIESLSPLLFCKYTPDLDDGGPEDLAAPMKPMKDLPRREQAERLAYRTALGVLCLPEDCIIRALRTSGAALKKPKGQGRGSLSKIMGCAVRVVGVEIPIFGPNDRALHDYEVDSRGAVNHNSAGYVKITVHRPRIDTWWASFALEIEDDLVSTVMVHQALIDAGRRVGVGAFRAELGGRFGRFSVTEWKVRKARKAA